MAALTATNVMTFPIGNRKMTIGFVSGVTSSGGYIPAATLKMTKITESYCAGDTGYVCSAVRNSQSGTADASSGDLYLDTGNTQGLYFTAIGR